MQQYIPVPSEFAQIDALYRELAKVSTDSSNLVSLIGQPAMSHAFFPGGHGLFHGDNANHFPVSSILVLESNFGAKEKRHRFTYFLHPLRQERNAKYTMGEPQELELATRLAEQKIGPVSHPH